MTKARKKVTASRDHAAISDALDTLALIIKQTKNRKLLPIFERLERELAALEDDDQIMARAVKRAGKRKTKKRAHA